MKTLDPIGLFRYLNPRASGLIVFKGGGGGASAAEVDSSVAAGTAAVNENTNARAAEAAEVGATITSNQDTMMGNQDQLKTGQSDIRRDIANIPQTTVVSQTVDTSGIENRIGSLEGTTSSGFADVGGRLDTVDNTLTGVQGSVDQGFANMNNSFNDITEGQQNLQGNIADLSTTATTGFDNLGTAVSTGFADTQDAINTGFTAQGEALDTASSNILGGQANLQSFLDDMSSRQDTYYGGLSEGQANIMDNVGGLQTTFNDFRNTYDDNTTLANQSRAQLQDMITGGFGIVREDMANANDVASRDRANIEAAVTNNAQATQDVAQQQAGMTKDFGQTLENISAGIEPRTPDEANAQQDVMQRLDVIRQVLATQGNNLDASIRDQYSKLATSFDQNGRLIRQSVDDAGNITNRAIDQQNNLLLATFNNTGQILDQSAINMNQLFGAMDRLGYTGGGTATGDLSPQILANRPAAVRSGLMGQGDPYFRTIG